MFEMHRKPSAPVALVIDVISWLVALTAFPFVFVDIAVRRVIHWLAIVIVSYIANQLNQHNFTLYYTPHISNTPLGYSLYPGVLLE